MSMGEKTTGGSHSLAKFFSANSLLYGDFQLWQYSSGTGGKQWTWSSIGMQSRGLPTGDQLFKGFLNYVAAPPNSTKLIAAWEVPYVIDLDNRNGTWQPISPNANSPPPSDQNGHTSHSERGNTIPFRELIDDDPRYGEERGSCVAVIARPNRSTRSANFRSGPHVMFDPSPPPGLDKLRGDVVLSRDSILEVS
jgi:hypothetical protein